MYLPVADPARLWSLQGKRALITGPVRGIGLAIASLFHAAGADLVLADRDGAGCDALAEEIGARSLAADVSSVAELEKLAANCGDIDVLVCNAGVPGPAGPMHHASAEDRDLLFAINMRHPLVLSGLLAPGMAKRGSGSIVLLSSIAGQRGNAAVGLYGMAKAAISQLARNLAVEWGPHGVRSNAIAPGLVATGWADTIIGNPDARDRRMQATPLRRIGQPEEIASLALFLASNASSFITGQTIVADGGTLISDGN